MVIMYAGAVTAYVVSTDLNVPRHFFYLYYLAYYYSACFLMHGKY